MTFIVFIHKTCLTIVQTICTQDGVQACAVKISSAQIVALVTILTTKVAANAASAPEPEPGLTLLDPHLGRAASVGGAAGAGLSSPV